MMFLRGVATVRLLELEITVFQEIMVKHLRDFHELGQINGLPLEQLINIGLLAIDFPGKPIDRTSLSQHLVADHLANVQIFHLEFHDYGF